MVCFLPVRKGSQRIPEKNYKDFNGIKGGLLKIKLDQLSQCPEINKVIISTNCDKVLAFLKSNYNNKYEIILRPEKYGNSNTTTDELIKYASSILPDGDILWTHVTSPFVDQKLYSKVIKFYYNLDRDSYDSLVSVSKIQSFVVDKKFNPANFNRSIRKWPFTQDINPLFEINSAIFIASKEVYIKQNDRIGLSPYLYNLNPFQSFDIDWQEDFKLAEKLFSIKNEIL